MLLQPSSFYHDLIFLDFSIFSSGTSQPMKSLAGLVFLCFASGSLCAPDGGSLRESRGGMRHQDLNNLISSHRPSTPTALPKTHTGPAKSELHRTFALSRTRTSQPIKRGLSHSDPDLPLGSLPGVSASTEPLIISVLSTSAPDPTASGVHFSVSATTTALPPIQSHPEQGRPQKKHPVIPSRSGRDLKIRNSSDMRLNSAPTPAPTGPSSTNTTVHISGGTDFALLLPGQRESIGDAESDGLAYCSSGSTFPGCSNYMQDGFITAVALEFAPDNASWIQVTGCLDPSKMSNVDPSDKGGQFDVRFPNGAQCSFGGYGASFIELVEPAGNRFCLRCCAEANDQTNCNSHQDRTGCPNAIPGTYNFPDQGISCSD